MTWGAYLTRVMQWVQFVVLRSSWSLRTVSYSAISKVASVYLRAGRPHY